jgi:hypothetical protein
MDHYEKVKHTETRIKNLVEESTKIMIQKNTERVDAWKGSGLFGQFIEIYSMFMRLKVLIWDRLHEVSNPPLDETGELYYEDWDKLQSWREDVRNALVDMRNFTVLGELCLDDDNLLGDPHIVAITCPDCGHEHKLAVGYRDKDGLQRIQERKDNKVS